MRIGLLTYHFVYNYGANLQALSTYFYFKNKGYTIKIINWQPEDTMKWYDNATSLEQVNEHKQVQGLFDLTSLCKTNDEVVSVLNQEKFDAIIIGSDAVIQYRPLIYDLGNIKGRLLEHSFPNPFMGLVDTEKFNVIYLSVSAQNTLYKGLMGFEKTNLRKYFSKVQQIYVRDTWTQDYFRKILKDDFLPPITPDPVFAFNNNCENLIKGRFEKLLFKYPFLRKKYLLLSFKEIYKPRTESWIRNFVSIAKQNDFNVVTLPYPQENLTFENTYSIELPLNPLDWYVLIANSSGYIGNNMHPIVTSIHNKVPFFIFDCYVVKRRFIKYTKTSSKIFDLLNKLGLADYYYNIKDNDEPLPENVFRKVCNFNTTILDEASESMYQQYKLMMNKIEALVQVR